MKEFKKYILGLLSVLFFTTATLFEYQTLKKHPEAKLIQTFQATLLEQEAKLSEYLKPGRSKD